MQEITDCGIPKATLGFKKYSISSEYFGVQMLEKNHEGASPPKIFLWGCIFLC